MRLTHRAITSPVYELIQTVEFDLAFGEDSWTVRVELFRDTEDRGRFRCHAWETELFRLTPSSRDGADQPAHVSDDYLQAERSHWVRRFDRQDFTAPSVE